MPGISAPTQSQQENRFLKNLRQREIPSLYGLRGIAALMVVLSHYSYGTRAVRFFPAGHAVNMFFVLSGLLITLLLLKEQDKSGSIDFKQFYIRRGLRLFPAFYAVWALCALFLSSFAEKWATFFYLGDYYLAITAAYGPLTIAWSLGVEEKFYLLWPALLSKVNRLKLIYGIVVVIVVDQIYRQVLVALGHIPYAAFAFDTNLGCILMGCLIALLAHRGIQFPNWMGSALIPVAAIVSLYTCNEIIVHYMLALTLIWSVIRAPWVLNNAVIKYLGLISYSLYLCHPFVQQVIWSPLFGQVHFPRWSLQLASKVAVALVAATVLHYAIERPFLRLKDRFHRKSMEYVPGR